MKSGKLGKGWIAGKQKKQKQPRITRINTN